VKSLLTACAFLLAVTTVSHSASWTASIDNTGALNLVESNDDGLLRIVIKGNEVKVFAFLRILERGDAAAFDVSTVLGAKKSKEKWAANTVEGHPGTLLEAPNGSALLADLLHASGSTFSVRVAPPKKLSVVADFSLSGFEEYKSQIEGAQSKATATPAPKATPKPPVVR
jgi:hypothetical protein